APYQGPVDPHSPGLPPGTSNRCRGRRHAVPGRHGSAPADVKLSAVALPQGTGQQAPERLAARTVEIPDPGDLVDLLPEPAGVAGVPPRDRLGRGGGGGRGPLPP